MCGSTCGFFGLSSLFNFRFFKRPSTTRVSLCGVVRWTWHATGKRTKADPNNLRTSKVDQNARMWGFYAIFSIFSITTGWQVPGVDELASRIPLMPLFSSWPLYTVRGGFSNFLGKGSLPTEYYLPLDSYYLPKWYYETGMNGTDLSVLDSDAAAFFPQNNAPGGSQSSRNKVSLGAILVSAAALWATPLHYR